MTEKEYPHLHKRKLSEQLFEKKKSALAVYIEKVTSGHNLWEFLKYEICTTLFSNVAGSIGYLSRKICYSYLLKKMGPKTFLGKGITIRHPKRISLGEGTAIDDYTLLDAGESDLTEISIGNRVLISRNCVMQGKTGSVAIADNSNIGCNTTITSAGGINIGNYVLVAGHCYIGGGRYNIKKNDIPIIEQGIYSRGPIYIEDDVWIGAGATILDGITIGRGSVIGAGAVVTRNIPEYSIAVGVPAHVERKRPSTASE